MLVPWRVIWLASNLVEKNLALSYGFLSVEPRGVEAKRSYRARFVLGGRNATADTQKCEAQMFFRQKTRRNS